MLSKLYSIPQSLPNVKHRLLRGFGRGYCGLCLPPTLHTCPLLCDQVHGSSFLQQAPPCANSAPCHTSAHSPPVAARHPEQGRSVRLLNSSPPLSPLLHSARPQRGPSSASFRACSCCFCCLQGPLTMLIPKTSASQWWPLSLPAVTASTAPPGRARRGLPVTHPPAPYHLLLPRCSSWL